MPFKKRRLNLVSERDKAVLKEFLAYPVPKQYFSLNERGQSKIDFEYYYEEIFDFADALVRGEEIDLNVNFVGVEASAVNEEFRKILDVLARRDPELEQFCDCFSKAVAIVEHAAN